MIAHVPTGNPIPLALQWVVAALLFGGLLAALAARRTAWRRLAIAVAICGLLGTVSTSVVGAMQPGPAPYSLRIIAPAAGTIAPHDVRFVLVNPSNQAYNPTASVDERVIVSAAPESGPHAC